MAANFRRRALRIILFCIFYAVVSPEFAAAQIAGDKQDGKPEISVSGVALPLDDLKTVSDSSLRVTVLGNSILVKRLEAPEVIGRIYSKSSRIYLVLSPVQLESFLLNSLRDGHADWISDITSNLIKDRSVTLDTWSLFRSVASVEGGRKALKEALESNGVGASSSVACEAGFWSRELGVSAPPMLHEGHCIVAIEKGLKETLRAGDGNIVGAFKDLLALSAENDFADLFPKIRQWIASVEAVEQKLNAADYQSLAKLLEQLKLDPVNRDVVPAYVSSRVEKLVKQRATGASPHDVLQMISLIDPGRRTPELHELVRSSLERLAFEKSQLGDSPETLSVLVGFARKDSGILSQLLVVLEMSVREALQKGDLQTARSLFDMLIGLRNDPSAENDRLRAEFGGALAHEGDVMRADQMIGGVQTGSPLWTRGKVLLSSPLAISFSVILVAFMLAFLIINRIWTGNTFESRIRMKKDKETQDQQERLKKFVKMQRMAVFTNEEERYKELLELFNLKRSASAGAIKAAYRNAVKSCHPDLNPNSGEEETKMFIRLTKAYEELLRLRDESGIK